jgi:hypothetical protein
MIVGVWEMLVHRPEMNKEAMLGFCCLQGEAFPSCESAHLQFLSF